MSRRPRLVYLSEGNPREHGGEREEDTREDPERPAAEPDCDAQFVAREVGGFWRASVVSARVLGSLETSNRHDGSFPAHGMRGRSGVQPSKRNASMLQRGPVRVVTHPSMWRRAAAREYLPG